MGRPLHHQLASARMIAAYSSELTGDLAQRGVSPLGPMSHYDLSARRMISAIRRELDEIEAGLSAAPARAA